MKLRILQIATLVVLLSGLTMAQHVHGKTETATTTEPASFLQKNWSNSQMWEHVSKKINSLDKPEARKEELRKQYQTWLKNRQLLIDGKVKQLVPDKNWDELTAEQKEGLVFFHPALNTELSSKPVITLTDPKWWLQDADCGTRPFCFKRGDPRSKGKGATECAGSDGKGCGRTCEDGSSPIAGCSAYCCENKCGCALCVESQDKPKKPAKN